MGFIRLKKVGKERYAYLVGNEWTPKGPRQRVAKYLGRYVELPPAPAPAVTGPVTPGILLGAELKARGFTDRLTHPDLEVTVNLKLCTVKTGRKNVVLGINGGFVCGHTLRRLLHHVPSVETTPGYALARAFSDAGVRVTREQFVTIYNNAYKRAREA
jgi:hypothetical protein